MRLLPLCLLCLLLAPLAFAQVDANGPKRIPGPGIALTDTERDRLARGVENLRQEIDSLDATLAPAQRILLPDVEIFHKAVDWALRYNEFYSNRDITYASRLLELGRERAAQLRAGQAPWLTATGMILRGHRSALDGSLQPYSILVPANASRERPSLLVFLLGRNERRTELAYFAEREAAPPPVVPAGSLVLIPYGRFCNATKMAGEVDVMESLAAVRAQYNVDPLRIAVGGFSMGGGSTWHLTAHYPGLWCASTPGAGFAETPAFSKALEPGKPVRTEAEKILWNLYDATQYAANFSAVPTVAYSGEIDAQIQAADIMEKAMAAEGLTLERLIGPQTAHKYHPETLKTLIARMETLIAQGREPRPAAVRFTTYTLRYPQSAWVRVEGLERHWQRSDVDAHLSGDGSVTLTTKNITALSLPGLTPSRVTVDGQSLTLPPGAKTRSPRFARHDGQWRLADDTPALRKRPGLTGPVDDAFMEPFLFVRPTGKPLNKDLGDWVESELSAAVTLWRGLYRGDVRVVSDQELTPELIATHHLVLWGDPSSNRVLAQALPGLPLRWSAKQLEFGGKSYDARHHAPVLIYPNPLNPQRYVVLNSGVDFRSEGSLSNALQTPKFPDWTILDLREPPNPRWPGKIVDSGFFDEAWK